MNEDKEARSPRLIKGRSGGSGVGEEADGYDFYFNSYHGDGRHSHKNDFGISEKKV